MRMGMRSSYIHYELRMKCFHGRFYEPLQGRVIDGVLSQGPGESGREERVPRVAAR